MLPELTTLIEQCAEKFRQGHEAEAATLLEQFVTSFSSAVDHTPALLTQKTEKSIAASLAYQESQDWIGLADELQYILKSEIENTPR